MVDWGLGMMLVLQVFDYLVDVGVGDFGGMVYDGQFVDVDVVEVWYYFYGGYEGEFIFVVFVDVWVVDDVQVVFVYGCVEGFVQQVVQCFVMDLCVEVLFDYFGWYFVWVEIFDVGGMGDFVEVVGNVVLQMFFWQ